LYFEKLRARGLHVTVFDTLLSLLNPDNANLVGMWHPCIEVTALHLFREDFYIVCSATMHLVAAHVTDYYLGSAPYRLELFVKNLNLVTGVSL
jgi:hypothetical protein